MYVMCKCIYEERFKMTRRCDVRYVDSNRFRRLLKREETMMRVCAFEKLNLHGRVMHNVNSILVIQSHLETFSK